MIRQSASLLPMAVVSSGQDSLAEHDPRLPVQQCPDMLLTGRWWQRSKRWAPSELLGFSTNHQLAEDAISCMRQGEATAVSGEHDWLERA